MRDTAVHTDFMIGGPEVDIDGQERGGAWVQILRNNQFQIA
jgi:leucyl aminopeptidase (aminopeptidase T)